jgi:hypothetical protein
MRKLCQRSNRFVVSKLPCFKIFIIIYIYMRFPLYYIQLFQLRLFPEQSGKIEYERERLLGIAYLLDRFISDPMQQPSYSTFPLCSGDNLN